MKFYNIIVIFVFLSACGGTPPAPLLSSHMSADNVKFGKLLNETRRLNGVAPVTFDGRLAVAAQNHANDMYENNFYSHIGSGWSDVGSRVLATGYDGRYVGENIYKSPQSEQAAMIGWTNSKGHHKNNINPNFEHFALARAGSGVNTYWVLVLGAEK